MIVGVMNQQRAATRLSLETSSDRLQPPTARLSGMDGHNMCGFLGAVRVTG